MSEQTTTTVNLSLSDLSAAANVINVATQRGAFNAAEAETVGATFNKLVQVVEALKPKTDDSEESDSQEDTVDEA